MRRPPNLMKSMTLPEPARPPADPDPPANYLDLYGLSKPPFDKAADSIGYILFSSHRRAFELLVEHIVNGSGIVLLLGAEGVGKTETLRSAAALATESGRETILVSRPSGGRVTLNQLVLALNGAPTVGPVAVKDAVERFEQPPRKVVIVDDVELMPDDCITLLLSLRQEKPDGADSPALVMSSSIELTGDAARPDLAQLSSLARNTIRLAPLTSAEVRQYIERSLWVVGGTTRRLISADAMKIIIARAGGLPGTVNRLMEAAFTAGFARGDTMITAKTVATAIGPAAPRPAPRRVAAEPSRLAGLALQIAAAALLVTGASVFLYKALTTPSKRPPPIVSSTPVQPARPTPPAPVQPSTSFP
jgi:type II secretory pathway predicted ATPase ExeA